MTNMIKLLNIQRDLKAPKSQYNSFGKYNYRNCEDILEAVKPLCAREKAVTLLSDKIIQIGERYYVEATATLYDAETGTEIAHATASAREEAEKKGMDGSQVTGSSSSYARKYALNGLFDIDDTKDADSDEQHNVTAQKNTGTAKQSESAEHTNEKGRSAEPEKTPLEKAMARKIIVRGEEKKLGDLTSAALQVLAQKAKEKTLRDDMLRVMQYKFQEEMKAQPQDAEDTDLPF